MLWREADVWGSVLFRFHLTSWTCACVSVSCQTESLVISPSTFLPDLPFPSLLGAGWTWAIFVLAPWILGELLSCFLPVELGAVPCPLTEMSHLSTSHSTAWWASHDVTVECCQFSSPSHFHDLSLPFFSLRFSRFNLPCFPVDFKLPILLPQPPDFRDYRHCRLCAVSSSPFTSWELLFLC